jgi:hypothetical protein
MQDSSGWKAPAKGVMTEITESATRPRLDEPNAINTNVDFCPVIGLVVTSLLGIDSEKFSALCLALLSVDPFEGML